MATTEATTETTTVATTERRRRLLSSLRSRIVGGYVGLMALATLASVGLVYQISIARIDARIENDLRQEVQELRKLARGNDPETGEPFGNRVRRIFDVFLQRNIPAENEVMLTFIDGEPYLRSRRVAPYRIDRDPDLLAQWADHKTPERGFSDTPAGTFDYLAVPLHTEDERAKGLFVVGVFRDLEEQEVVAPVVAAGAVGIATLLLGSILAWRLAGRVIDPVERVTQTAVAISETDLTRRIEVQGSDEIAHLATTFNAMLDRLEDAFRAQRQFIDDAGHELRTPITVIRGHLELLGDDPRERRETLAIVTDELDRMSRMVNDLLVLAKAQRPDFLQLQTVDVAALTAEIESKAKALAARRWAVESTGKGVIVADRQRLTQAVMQLAENAAHHTEDGDEIAIGSQIADGVARIWVRDSGPGIRVEDQDKIFRRFERADARRTSSEGAGLGLAIARTIAEAHRGTLDLDSRPGAGATFTITVPVDQPRLSEEL
jgi:two-component system, OmpR family, sensor kinase